MEVINLKEQLNRYRSSVGKDTIPFDSVLHDYDFAVARVVNNSVAHDEPTGALDSRATDELLRVFSDISASGQTILMVTHSVRAASRAGRVLFIKDGEVCHQLYRGGMTDDQLYQKITDALTVLQAGGERV